MANITTLLKYSLKTNIVKSIFFEIISKVSRYYYTYGKTTAWPTVNGIDENNQSYVISSEDNPPAAVDTYPYELQTRRDMIYMKLIDANDAAIVVRRLNWIAGTVYDMYDDYSSDRVSYNGAQSIDQAYFFVLTDEFNVYKCLYNNNNSQSTQKPTGNSTEPILLEDGYLWKFMYSIPLSLRNKFVTTSYMPVTTALTNQFYSKGSIVSYDIENRGKGYIKNTWSVKKFNILNTGRNYNINTVTITFPNAPSGGITATAVVTEVNETGGIMAIAVTNPGSGYITQPVPTITSASGVGISYDIEYDADPSAYTKLAITGDGYNENNPYNLKKINIINRGVFSAPISGDLFTFPSPKTQYGRRPIVTVTFRLIGAGPSYEVDTVAVVDPGYGYTEPLIFSTNVFATPLTAYGFECNLDQSSQKNEAELIPLINSSGEIEAIQIVSPGIGYTYASVEVIGKKTILMVPGDPGSANLVDIDATNTPNFVKAKVLLSFGVGDIETKQSNVELLAIDGAIPVIKVDFGGNGYPSSTTLTVVGDGSGCICQPIISNGKITSVLVTNPGEGYTAASVQISQGGTGAILRPIISPKGGHGKDAVYELYANSIMLVNKLANEKNKNVDVTTDYRQICILKNPKEYTSDAFYRKNIGSTCALFVCDITAANTSTYAILQQDDTLYFSSTKSFTLVEKSQINNKYYLVVQINDNYIPNSGSSIYKLSGSTSYSISISSIENPDVNKYSGELMYIDNKAKFVSSTDQTIVTSTLISF